MLHEQQAPAPPPPVAAAALPSAPTSEDDDAEESVTTFRDIHPLTPDDAPTRAASWDTASHHSFASSEEQYMTMSREFTAMVAAGGAATTDNSGAAGDPLASIGEDEMEETNPLAIVPDSHPIATPARSAARLPALDLEVVPAGGPPVEASRVKKEEVETKIAAWQTAEMAKINNRFKREEIVINGWETEQLDNASAWLKKIQEVLLLCSNLLRRRIRGRETDWSDMTTVIIKTLALAEWSPFCKSGSLVPATCFDYWRRLLCVPVNLNRGCLYRWLCTQRKLDEQRAKALEKTQNDIAKARRKAEEKRASAEAKRGLKLAKVLELASFMKAVGRVPTKRSFFNL